MQFEKRQRHEKHGISCIFVDFVGFTYGHADLKTPTWP
jgi:hypothetical protein